MSDCLGVLAKLALLELGAISLAAAVLVCFIYLFIYLVQSHWLLIVHLADQQLGWLIVKGLFAILPQGLIGQAASQKRRGQEHESIEAALLIRLTQ